MRTKGDKRLADAQTYFLSKLQDPNDTSASWNRTGKLKDAEKEGYSSAAREYLVKQMQEKSGDWYYGESKTAGHRKLCEELNKNYDVYNKALEKVRSKYSGKALTKALQNDATYQAAKRQNEKLVDELMGQVLRDIGWPDTPDNRAQAQFFAYREH